jgi:Prokaryotic phospholipase A2
MTPIAALLQRRAALERTLTDPQSARVPHPQGGSVSRTTLMRLCALGALVAAAALAPPASADTEIDRDTATVPGAKVDATMMQRENGAIYVNVVVHDTAADGICAHGTIRWLHVNGSAYNDYGMHACGALTGKSFTAPERDWRAYKGFDVGAFVDGGAPRYKPILRWDRGSLKARADSIMSMSSRRFMFRKRLAATWPFDWKDNGCSGPTPRNWRELFYWACAQHDFGYRNYGQYLRLGRNETTRKWIDNRFRRELLNICRYQEKYLMNHCILAAHTMWGVVRAEGRPYFYGE